MPRGRRVAAAVAVMAAAVVAGSSPGEAHKPITSPYTFNEDIYPILLERCGKCHVAGGVGPMSLLTHQDTVPWSESMRIELIAGHMPPWSVEASADRLHSPSLTGRELNMLLTWASGGTPIGADDKTPAPRERDGGWPLGVPDLVMPLPEFTMDGETQEGTAEIVMPIGGETPRWLRAVDFQPGTASIVRSARILARPARLAPSDRDRRSDRPESVLSVWVPGDDPVSLEAGTAFRLPEAAELVIRVRYKKTWQYERMAMTDRSRVGLYFASNSTRELRSLILTPASEPGPAAGASPAAGPGRAIAFTHVMEDDLQALAIYPDVLPENVTVTVDAVRPGGPTERLITFRAQRDWARRFWLARPVPLPRGARVLVRAVVEAPGPAILVAPPSAPARPLDLRLALNVVSAAR